MVRVTCKYRKETNDYEVRITTSRKMSDIEVKTVHYFISECIPDALNEASVIIDLLELNREDEQVNVAIFDIL